MMMKTTTMTMMRCVPASACCTPHTLSLCTSWSAICTTSKSLPSCTSWKGPVAHVVDREPCCVQVETIYLGDRRIQIRTSVLEEKSTACNMLCCYADELKEGFLPWVQQASAAGACQQASP
jgi:hypothetical protein